MIKLDKSRLNEELYLTFKGSEESFVSAQSTSGIVFISSSPEPKNETSGYDGDVSNVDNAINTSFASAVSELETAVTVENATKRDAKKCDPTNVDNATSVGKSNGKNGSIVENVLNTSFASIGSDLRDDGDRKLTKRERKKEVLSTETPFRS